MNRGMAVWYSLKRLIANARGRLTHQLISGLKLIQFTKISKDCQYTLSTNGIANSSFNGAFVC